MFNRIALACTAALTIAAVPAASFAATLGSNLIVNGNAEADVGSDNGDQIGPVTGFASTGQFTVVQYGAGGGFPQPTDPGPTDRGLNFFAGGPSAAVSTGSQVILVGEASVAIDGGNVNYDLSAWLGGFSTQDDNAVLTLAFLDTDSAQLGSTSLGPVTEPERGGNTGLLFLDQMGLVPAGTRSIDVTLTLTREEGSYDDGYADNLSLVLSGGQPVGGARAGQCDADVRGHRRHGVRAAPPGCSPTRVMRNRRVGDAPVAASTRTRSRRARPRSVSAAGCAALRGG